MMRMKIYTSEDVRVCLSNSCGLLIAASKLFKDKNLKPYSPALVELAFEELGKTICVYKMSELGEEFLNKIKPNARNCETTFTEHDVKIEEMKEFIIYIRDKFSKKGLPLNNRDLIKDFPEKLGLNKKKQIRFKKETKNKYNITSETSKRVMEVINRSLDKDILKKDHSVIKNMREDSLYVKILSGKMIKNDKVDPNMISIIAFLVYSISSALIGEVGELEFSESLILDAAYSLSVKSSLHKEIEGMLKR